MKFDKKKWLKKFGLMILIIPFVILLALFSPTSVSVDKDAKPMIVAPATNEEWKLEILGFEDPYHIKIDLNSIKQNDNCISFDGRFWTGNATVIPLGTKYFGITFKQQLQSGNLSYRNYQSKNTWTIKKGNDFSYLPYKYSYTDVYYLPFEFVNLIDKEFKINVCFNEKPTQGILYFGSGSTVILITQVSAGWTIKTEHMNWNSTNARVAMYFKILNGPLLTDAAETSVNVFYEGADWNCGSGTAGVVSFTENGSIRTKMKCSNINGQVTNTHYFNTNWWTSEMFTTTNNYSMGGYSLKPDGSLAIGLIIGDGTHNGSALGDPGSAYHELNESWACYEKTSGGSMALCHFWSLNISACDESYSKKVFADVMSRGGMTFIGGSSAANDQFFTPSCKFTFRTIVINETLGINGMTYRRAWNSTFKHAAITVTNNSGTTLVKESAQELKCIQSSDECDVSLVFKPQTNLTALGGNPDVVFIQAGNFSTSNIKIYNRSDTTEPASGDLLHHLVHNGTAWTFGTDDPSETAGEPLSNPDTELRVQVCDIDSSACNTMTSTDVYVVFMAQGFKTENTQRIEILAVNTIPVVANHTLLPATAYADSTLNCTFQINDGDGDTLTAVVDWLKDDAKQFQLNYSATNAVLDSNYLEPANISGGENWSCQARGFDTKAFSNTSTKAITITNTVPTVSDTTIVPTIAYAYDDLNCTYKATDKDGRDVLSGRVEWLKDDTSQFILNETITNATIEYGHLESANTSYNQNWTCYINVWDGTGNSTMYALNKTISNSLPELSGPILLPISPLESHDLNCSFNLTDRDSGQALSVNVSWLKNSVFQFAFNLSIINGSSTSNYLDLDNTTRDENWTCEVKGFDSVSYTVTKSASVNITNTPPTTDSISLTPIPAYTTNDLNCSWTHSDNDTANLTGVVYWYKDSALIVTLNYSAANSSILESENTTRGQNWTCNIRSWDGSNHSIGLNTSLVVQNTAPTIPDQVFPPNNYNLYNTSTYLNCTNSSDVDSDTIRYEFWGDYNQNVSAHTIWNTTVDTGDANFSALNDTDTTTSGVNFTSADELLHFNFTGLNRKSKLCVYGDYDSGISEGLFSIRCLKNVGGWSFLRSGPHAPRFRIASGGVCHNFSDSDYDSCNLDNEGLTIRIEDYLGHDFWITEVTLENRTLLQNSTTKTYTWDLTANKTYEWYCRANDAQNISGNSSVRTIHVNTSRIYAIEESHNNVVFSSTLQHFYFNVSYFTDTVINLTYIFHYNGTNYSSIIVNKTSLGYEQLNVSIHVPSFSALTNLSLYWIFHYVDINGSVMQQQYGYNQSITSLILEYNCTVSATNVAVINFSFYEEPSWSPINANFSATFWIWSSTKDKNNTFVINNTGNQNSFIVCLKPNNTLYRTDMIAEYVAGTYSKREYHLINRSLNSTVGNNITVKLYLLKTTDATNTNIYSYDLQDDPYKKRYIFVERYAVGSNLYRLVTILRTDDNGKAVVPLQHTTAWYRFKVYEYPDELEFTSDPRKITDNDIYLRYSETTFGSILNRLDTVVPTLTYNPATTTFRGEFTTTGAALKGCLRVIKVNLTNFTEVCHTCETSASTTLLCQIDNTTGHYTATLTIEGSLLIPLLIYNLVVSDITGLFDLMSVDNKDAHFIGIMILGTTALTGLINPALGGVMMVVGLIVVVGFGLMKLSWVIIAILTFGVIIILTQVKT